MFNRTQLEMIIIIIATKLCGAVCIKTHSADVLLFPFIRSQYVINTRLFFFYAFIT